MIPWDSCFQEHLARVKLDTLDEKLLLKLLETTISGISNIPQAPSAELLDAAAWDLCTAIGDAYHGSARRALGRGTGQPW